MQHAETVTFGGSALDRAAHLRGDAQQMAQLWQKPDTQVVLLWRGKPLVLAESLDQLHWLHAQDPLVSARQGDAVFLGLDEDGQARFAADLSDWQPDVLPEDLNAFVDLSLQHHPDLPETVGFAELRRVMARLSARDAEYAAMARGLFEWHRSHGFCSNCGAPNTRSFAGWQATCSSCGRHHFPRTDPVVIMLITRGNSVLMGRSPGWPEGMYSLLAGFVEPGETIEAAVRRETFEEAGIRVGGVSYLASQPWPFPASLMMGCRGQAVTDDIKIDPEEIEDALWVSREEMLLSFAGEHSEIAPARSGAIARFLLENWLADRLD